MSNLDQKQLVELLIKTERTADKILQSKQQIVALDRCRQTTREAVRNLDKSTQDKAWITLGSNLIKLEKSKALDLLKKGNIFVEEYCTDVSFYICGTFTIYSRSTSARY